MDISFSCERLGYIRVASASPKVALADPGKNVEYILQVLSKDSLGSSDIIVLPELCITGYTCGDLFFQDSLVNEAENALIVLAEQLRDDHRLVAVGCPVMHKGSLYNCAVLICYGKIVGVVPKMHIPNYQEFYEKRWFRSGAEIKNDDIKIGGKNYPFGINLLFDYMGVRVGVEICEDLWVPSPPSSSLCMAGAEIILNLSATDDNIGKYAYIKSLVSSQSGRCRCAYVYASAGRGESSTDLVFSGINIIGYDGEILAESERFSLETGCVTAVVDMEKLRHERLKYSSFYDSPNNDGDYNIVECVHSILLTCDKNHTELNEIVSSLHINPYPFIPAEGDDMNESCAEIVNIQSWGLARRLEAANCKSLVIGISGGLDSTLALLVAHKTFRTLGMDVKGIWGVTMPAEATSHRTRTNAGQLMERLGVSSLEIPIKEAVSLHFSDIKHDPDLYDAVYENSQARERTQVLMDLANKFSGMVLGTGDMSELALGWCTYNGDHMSMYNVNAGVPKTLVRYLVQWFAEKSNDKILRGVLKDIIDTPISPELIPSDLSGRIAQKTEEIVGPYELHDFFLFHVLRNGFAPKKIFTMATVAFKDKYEQEVIKKWMINFYKRFFSQQFKRSCMPDGPKVGSVCLSPRGDWRMPSDASASIWIKEAENINC